MRFSNSPFQTWVWMTTFYRVRGSPIRSNWLIRTTPFRRYKKVSRLWHIIFLIDQLIACALCHFGRWVVGTSVWACETTHFHFGQGLVAFISWAMKAFWLLSVMCKACWLCQLSWLSVKEKENKLCAWVCDKGVEAGWYTCTLLLYRGPEVRDGKAWWKCWVSQWAEC